MPIPIEELWLELAHSQGRPVFRRVDEEHPLDLYAGLSATESWMLMLVSKEEPPAPPPYDTISVSSRQRADGSWALLLELNSKDLFLPFARLCQDLIDASRLCDRDGPSIIISRLARWRRLLEVSRKALSEPALRGLIGELLILRDSIAPRFGFSASVNAWIGPSKAPQDFLLGGVAVEVKTITPTATSISISSLDQLDANSQLDLATILLTPSSSDQSGAFNPITLVHSISNNLDDQTLMEFNLRLAEAGYEELPEYESKWYHCSGVRYYGIGEGFPRLTTTTAPHGIIEATYQVSINSCTSYERSGLWT